MTTAKYQRTWRARNPERQAAIAKRQRLKRAERNRRLLQELKSAPCTDCGLCYPYWVMQFDHVRGEKKFEIGKGLRGKSMAQLREEVAKCELVCANCHADRTYQRASLAQQ